MLLAQDPETGYWNYLGDGVLLRTHSPGECQDRKFCDVHDRRPGWERVYPLNWRDDRSLMEFVCEHDTGHPTTAQLEYWDHLVANGLVTRDVADEESIHGCCGCCMTSVKELETSTGHDPVNHPKHYNSDPSGVECIEITRHRTFNIGNAFKYLWRAGLKGEETQVQDLEKAVFYIKDEINRLKGAQ